MNLSHCQILWIFLNILCPGLFVIIGQLRVEIFYTEKNHFQKSYLFSSRPFDEANCF